MLRTITLVTVLLAYVVSAQAQGMKFGVHVDPLISLLGSNETVYVEGDGMNFGFAFGVEGEYYFQEGENYAISFGANFALGRGGTLKYKYAGDLLSRSEVFANDYTNYAGDNPSSPTGVRFTPGTSIKYNANYIEIPFGLKLRTNELGDSYMRAFFHLPVATIGIPISARASVEAPAASSVSDSLDWYGGSSSASVNSISEMGIFQFSLGAGAGVEYAPNEEGGLRLVGGLYYHYGFTDMVRRTPMFTQTGYNDSFNAKNGFHNIGLRIGVIF